MKPLPENLSEVLKELRRSPIEAVARRYGRTPLDLSVHLRRNLHTKRLLSVKAHELQYLIDNYGSTPAVKLREKLAMSPSQFRRIVRRYGLKQQSQ